MKTFVFGIALVMASVSFAGTSKTTTCLDITGEASSLFEAHSNGMSLPTKAEMLQRKGSQLPNGKMKIDVIETVRNGVKLTKIGFHTKEEVLESIYATCINSDMWKK